MLLPDIVNLILDKLGHDRKGLNRLLDSFEEKREEVVENWVRARGIERRLHDSSYVTLIRGTDLLHSVNNFPALIKASFTENLPDPNDIEDIKDRVIPTAKSQAWFTLGYNERLHDQPSIIRNRDVYIWKKRDHFHRENGPAYDSPILKRWMIKGEFHNANGPAIQNFSDDGKLVSESYYQNGQLHNTNGPAEVVYEYPDCGNDRYDEKDIRIVETWRQHGQVIRENDQPTRVTRDSSGFNRTEEYLILGTLHRDSGPAKTVYENNVIVAQDWLLKDMLHNENGPARLIWKGESEEKKILVSELWCINGMRHRKNGPALIFYDCNGKVEYESYYHISMLHRLGGPAITKYENGKWTEQIWFNEGCECSVNDLPSRRKQVNGVLTEETWVNKFGKLHRNVGPAKIIYHSNGRIHRSEWYQNGLLHRANKAAIISYSNTGEVIESKFYENGVFEK